MIVLFLAWCVYVHASYVNNIWKLFVWMRNAGARSFAPNASECEIGQLWGYECDCLIQCASHFYVCFCFTLWVCVCVYLFISFPLSLHIIARFITSYSETVMCIFWFFVTVCILRFYLVLFFRLFVSASSTRHIYLHCVALSGPVQFFSHSSCIRIILICANRLCTLCWTWTRQQQCRNWQNDKQ